MSDPTSYFTRLGETTFRATAHTGGAWTQSEQHISPMTGLVTHAIERHVGDDGLVLGRLSMDIHGTIDVDDFELTVATVRPGRTISLVEATVTRSGRTVATARAWRLVPSDTTSVHGGQAAPLPSPDSVPVWDMAKTWPGGYIDGLEVRRTVDSAPGRCVAWIRSGVDVVDAEPVSDLARWMALVDTANGIAVRESPDEWLFPNLDLTIHLYRRPSGPWVGFDTTVVFGADGVGLTETVLHDVTGPVGRAAQILTLRPRR